MYKKILIITHDKVGPQMAGPGMRYHQMALELSKKFDVTLGAFKRNYISAVPGAAYKTSFVDPQDFKTQFDEVDVVIALKLDNEMIKYAKSTGTLLVFDLYAPVPVEDLANHIFSGKLSPETDYNYAVMLETYKNALAAGDYFLCSNDIQRDFWTGFGFAGDSVTPSGYDDFPLYERIGLCPMGINLDELESAGKTNPLRKRFPVVKKDDFVLVWTGGIWDWFDALTPINAIKRLQDESIKNVRLVFLGTQHPNPDIPKMNEGAKAVDLANQLGLTGKSVFFMEGWLDYHKRLDYFMSASAAIYAHKPSIEARFSHRTRVLDHILAGLPTIATKGDYFAGLIQEQNLGVSVPPSDDHAMAEAIKSLMNHKNYAVMKTNLEKIRPDYTWENTLRPLVDFLEEDIAPRQTTNSNRSAQARNLANKRGVRGIKRLLPSSFKKQIKTKL